VCTIPLTIVPFILCLLLFETTERVDITLHMVPVGMIATLLILLLWRFLPPHLPMRYSNSQRLLLMGGITFIVWGAILAAFTLTLTFLIESHIVEEGDRTSWIIGGLSLGFYFFSVMIFIIFGKLPVGRKGDEDVSFWSFLTRFLVGFAITVLSLSLSKYNIFAGGISIAFPCVSITALSSLWISQSHTVAMGATQPIMIGSAATSIYALIFSAIDPILTKHYGSLGGHTISILATWYFVVMAYSIPALIVLRKKEILEIEQFGKIILDSDRASSHQDDMPNASPNTQGLPLNGDTREDTPLNIKIL